jgi:flagellar biosynthesis/type III secretory pathway M-ring protein FliF/YscJ
MELSLKKIKNDLGNLSKVKKIIIAIVFSVVMVISSLAVIGFTQGKSS